MRDGVEFRVQGVPELGRDLDRLASHIEDPAVLGEIADDTARSLAAAAPRKSGRLASSFRGHVEGAIAVTESAVPYAGVIQGGWPRRGIAAAHYVERAEQQYVPHAVEQLDDHLTREIKKEGLQ